MERPNLSTSAQLERHMEAARQLRAETVGGACPHYRKGTDLADRVGNHLRGTQGLVRFDVQRLTGPHSRTPRV